MSSDTRTPDRAKWLTRKRPDLSTDLKLRPSQPDSEHNPEIRGGSACPTEDRWGLRAWALEPGGGVHFEWRIWGNLVYKSASPPPGDSLEEA